MIIQKKSEKDLQDSNIVCIFAELLGVCENPNML